MGKIVTLGDISCRISVDNNDDRSITDSLLSLTWDDYKET